MKKPLIVIAGPTACGKTDLSIQIAKKLNGEIISADSMQVYKYMDIGTAKPTIEEMEGIKHYLIDELYPDEEYSIAFFKNKAKKYIDEIYHKNKIPIICGGTGFYINSIVYDNDFEKTITDNRLRDKLYNIASLKGNEFVHNMLKNIDQESAEKIHFNNLKRVIRAIEYFSQTGQKISSHNEIEKLRESSYNCRFIILERDRNILYDRINRRVDIMFEKGLVEEVKWLLDNGYNKNLVSMKGIGYKEVIDYFENKLTLEEVKELIKKNTRHFAKRQLTWFRHQAEGDFFDIEKSNIDDLFREILCF